MNEYELRMVSYRAIVNNLIVKSTSCKLTGEEAMFKETALACFNEDLKSVIRIMEHNRKNLEKGLADGTFEKTSGKDPHQGSIDEEP